MSKRRSDRKKKPPHEAAVPPVQRRLFLLDENVSASIARFLTERGHDVRLVQDELGEGASDRMVADYADEIEATVITFNVKHFEPLIYRAPRPNKKRAATNSWIAPMSSTGTGSPVSDATEKCPPWPHSTIMLRPKHRTAAAPMPPLRTGSMGPNGAMMRSSVACGVAIQPQGIGAGGAIVAP